MPVRRTGLRAVVSQRRSLKGAAPLPKVYLAAGVATIGAMLWAILREDSSAREPRVAAASKAQQRRSGPVRTIDGSLVSADNVPKYVLANSGLDNEQKLSVALCRRQAWLRAAQAAPTLALWTYATCVLVEHAGLAKLPRGSRTAAPLVAAVVGGTIGAYWGGLEGKPMMNAALAARPIEHVHKRRSERPPEEDALVSFIREGTRTSASESRS